MRDYFYIGIIILLILVIIVFLIILLTKKTPKNNEEETKLFLINEYNKMKMDLINYFNSSNIDNRNNVNNLSKNIDEKFDAITNKLEGNLKTNFETTNKTFLNVTERLIKLDEQNKSIEKLSTEVLSLNNILNDKKTRGIFGEVQLNQLLESVFASDNRIYNIQHKLSNGKIADAIIHAPSPLGSICVDSKFPLETFNKIQEETNKDELKRLNKQFDDDIKKHLNDIKNKYIIKDETSDQAIMFIPAEGVYNEVIKNHIDVVYYANNNKIWVTSPTSLLSTLTVINQVLINLEKSKKTHLILDELKSLSIEFNRYFERWNNINNQSIKMIEQIKELNITSLKLKKRFDLINEGKLDDL